MTTGLRPLPAGARERLRVAVVAPQLPHPPFTGAHTRPLSMIRALAVGHEVLVVGAAPDDADLAALDEVCAEVVRLPAEPYARGPAGRVMQRSRKVFTPVPLISHSRFPELAALVEQTIADTRPDVVHLEGMYSAHYRPQTGRTSIDLLDVVSGLCDAAAKARPFRYAGARLARRWSESAERSLLAAFDAVIAINAEDAARLGRLGIESRVVPLSVELPDEPLVEAGRTPQKGDEGLRLLFVGNFLHQPNRQAASFIERGLVPALQRRGQRFKLVVAGRAAAPTTGVRDPAIEYRCDLPDLGPSYAECDIVLVPLEYGGGTKNKTLEAMAWSRAVVGSPQAFTGIEARPDEAFVSVPYEAEAMAEAVVRLGRDRERRLTIASAGRRYVAEHHTQAIVEQRVAEIFARFP